MSYDNLSNVSQNILKCYQQLTGEEKRIPFIFDGSHFYRARVIGLDMMENRIFTLRPQGLVTTHVNILSMYKHVQRRTSFLPPLAPSRVCFLNSF